MTTFEEINGQTLGNGKCIAFTFGDCTDTEADLMSLKIISELIECGYVITGYSDDCHYWEETGWTREIFVA